MRALLIGCLGVLVLLCGCRSARGRNAPSGSVRWFEKPWTREAIEATAYLYVETASGRQIVIPGPVLAADDKGEYLTKRDEPSRRLDLSEVTEMGEFDPQAAKAAEEAQAAQPKSTAGVLAGSFLALWGAVLFFLPAFAVYLLVA